MIVLVALFSFVVHELAHWACGTMLGYDMYVGINKAGLASGHYSDAWHLQLVSAGGPILTIAIAISALWAVHRHNWLHMFPVVFFSAMMRGMAMFVSISNPNDEARVSQWMGIGTWTLPVLVLLTLGWATFLAARKLELRWTSWAVCFVTSSATITAVVLTERYWPVFNAPS